MKKLLTVSLCLAVVSAVLLGSLVHAAPQGPWVKHTGNPVLTPGAEGEWDQNAVYYAHVLPDSSGYKMWYTGYDANWVARIGYAESPDGINWTKYTGNPVLSPGPEGSWDSAWIGKPTVVKVDGTYRIWYQGRDAEGRVSIGYAESSDSIVWTKHASNPVLSPGSTGSWDGQGVNSPTVLYHNGLFHMWYHVWGSEDDDLGRIGYATSADGVNWTKSLDNPVLAGGDSGSWEYPHIFDPTVVFDPADDVYRMWYTSFNEAASDTSNRFGYATSLDGVHWTKYPLNPVFYAGTAGSWDSGDIHDPCVIVEGDTFKMWYAGHDGSYGIGYAVAPVGGSITGHIYDDASAPLASARIYALDDDLNVIAGAVSEADGGYAIVDLPTDDYYLEVNAAGYGREYYDGSHDIAGATQVSVTVPITTADVDFALAPGGAISGDVYERDGITPFDGAMVEVKPAGGGRPLKTTSGSDGAYAVDDLATGSYDAWAGHSSYLADAPDAPIAVTQPNTTTDVDFTLAGPYFPLNVGDKWIYSWSNDTYHPDLITEAIQAAEKSGDRYAFSCQHAEASGQFWINQQSDGLFWSGYGTGGMNPFPVPMYMLLYYAYVPLDFLSQPLSPGESWVGYGRTESSLPNHEGLSTVTSVIETVTVAAGTFTDVMHIHTVISGTDDYLSGERDMWFAPGVGLVKLDGWAIQPSPLPTPHHQRLHLQATGGQGNGHHSSPKGRRPRRGLGWLPSVGYLVGQHLQTESHRWLRARPDPRPGPRPARHHLGWLHAMGDFLSNE
jgi:predicted GH43/DUF377 family glycosyl hydrolase